MRKWSTVFLLVGCMLFSANALTLSEKEKFVDFYRGYTGLLSEFPDRPEVVMLCFDLNCDGIEEIIVSDNDPIRSDRSGYFWSIYSKQENNWVSAKLKTDVDNNVDPVSSLSCRTGDFYSLSETGKPSRLIVIYTSYSKNREGATISTTTTSEVIIDSEGFLLNTPMTNLTVLLNDPLVPRQLVKLIPETFTEVPAYKPRPPESGISTNQTIVIEEVPVLKSGTTEK